MILKGTMSYESSLSGQFLIAMPSMTNPLFEHTVTYICEHNEQGAMGFVINRVVGITLADLYQQIDIKHIADCHHLTKPVFNGGPVEGQRGFVLHTGKPYWDASTMIDQGLVVSTSVDIIEAIGCGEGPEDFLFILGYAGWHSGQLEKELIDNAWLSGPAHHELIFGEDIKNCWRKAVQRIGFDVNQLHSQAGHA